MTKKKYEVIMKTLIFGAGPIGSLYAYLLHKAGKDVTILARNKHLDFIKENGVVLVNEFTGKKEVAKMKVVEKLDKNDSYDLVVVAIRKNKIQPVLQVLSQNQNIKNILFLGNNALGFDAYLEHLPKENVLFGFGRAGGGWKDHVVHYVDSEKPNGKRMPVIFGEIDRETKERTRQIKAFFESAEVPVEIADDMDGWLKYHIAMVFPMCAVLLKNGCDNYKLAENKDDIRCCLRAFKEAGIVLKALGYKRQPFKLNLFYWIPEFLIVKIYQKILSSKFAEIAFAMHARAAADEFKEHTDDFKTLIDKTSVKTPKIDKLRGFFS
jgi:2-dehydropantoate 2-reductase